MHVGGDPVIELSLVDISRDHSLSPMDFLKMMLQSWILETYDSGTGPIGSEQIQNINISSNPIIDSLRLSTAFSDSLTAFGAIMR